MASPRHADALVVTGPVTRNMADALRKTYEAAPRPCLVVSLGDCARDCGMFAGGHGVAGPVADFVPVDVEVPGCPRPGVDRGRAARAVRPMTTAKVSG